MGVLQETRIGFPAVAKEQGVNRQTVHRWADNGANGHKLEAAWVGGRRFTSREAVERFLKAINAPSSQPGV